MQRYVEYTLCQCPTTVDILGWQCLFFYHTSMDSKSTIISEYKNLPSPPPTNSHPFPMCNRLQGRVSVTLLNADIIRKITGNCGPTLVLAKGFYKCVFKRCFLCIFRLIAAIQKPRTVLGVMGVLVWVKMCKRVSTVDTKSLQNIHTHLHPLHSPNNQLTLYS